MKIGSIRTLFKEFDRDYYKPITIDGAFARRNNNCIEYTSKGDSIKIYHLKNILMWLDHNNNNNNNNNNRSEWKI